MRRTTTILCGLAMLTWVAVSCGGDETAPTDPVSPSNEPNATVGRCSGPGFEGYEIWDVSTEPYQVDNEVDENGNGQVCALPLDETFEDDNGETHQIYDFIDDVI